MQTVYLFSFWIVIKKWITEKHVRNEFSSFNLVYCLIIHLRRFVQNTNKLLSDVFLMVRARVVSSVGRRFELSQVHI